jgi:hypothetical protein
LVKNVAGSGRAPCKLKAASRPGLNHQLQVQYVYLPLPRSTRPPRDQTSSTQRSFTAMTMVEGLDCIRIR